MSRTWRLLPRVQHWWQRPHNRKRWAEALQDASSARPTCRGGTRPTRSHGNNPSRMQNSSAQTPSNRSVANLAVLIPDGFCCPCSHTIHQHKALHDLYIRLQKSIDHELNTHFPTIQHSSRCRKGVSSFLYWQQTHKLALLTKKLTNNAKLARSRNNCWNGNVTKVSRCTVNAHMSLPTTWSTLKSSSKVPNIFVAF